MASIWLARMLVVQARGRRPGPSPPGGPGWPPRAPRRRTWRARHAGGDRVGQQVVAADQADSGLVAGGLDTQYQGGRHHGSAFRMTTASTPEGW